MPPIPPIAQQLLAVDSHVHLHDMTDLPGFFDSARQAFGEALDTLTAGRQLTAMLVLTEPWKQPAFSYLRQQLGRLSGSNTGGWKLESTAEDISLKAEDSEGNILLLVSGQQIVTSEKLEVLSLAAEPAVADGLNLAETVSGILANDGLPVLPWGVGKWLGPRGENISSFLKAETNRPIFLGDNGGRPAIWQSVPQFDLARQIGIPILRGSDPLRCSFRRRGAGSFGTLLSCSLDITRPGKSLRQILTNGSYSSTDFGSPESLWNFCKDQISLRIS